MLQDHQKLRRSPDVRLLLSYTKVGAGGNDIHTDWIAWHNQQAPRVSTPEGAYLIQMTPLTALTS